MIHWNWLGRVAGASLLAFGVLAHHAAADPVVWTGLGGSSDWSNAENWWPKVVPDNNGTHYNVYIDNGAPSNAEVVLSRHAKVGNLTISAGDALTLLSSTGASLTIEGGTLENHGQLALDDTFGSWRALIFTGQSTLRGAGQVTLSPSATNRIDGDGASRLTIEGHTIIGSGSLGRDGGGPLAITIRASSGQEVPLPPVERRPVVEAGQGRNRGEAGHEAHGGVRRAGREALIALVPRSASSKPGDGRRRASRAIAVRKRDLWR